VNSFKLILEKDEKRRERREERSPKKDVYLRSKELLRRKKIGMKSSMI
jgi:hypothetical protein